MSLVVVVAEKPSVAKDIARALQITGRDQGAFFGTYAGFQMHITWAIGHLVGIAEPEVMNPAWKKWQREMLPMIPGTWHLSVLQDGKSQFQIVRRLLNQKNVTKIVCATDAGREGELIFRYIAEACQIKKPVERLWLSSLTDQSIRKAMSALIPSAQFDSLYFSARSRSRADWLIGMNFSRAYTLKSGKLFSIGRVQTPTLALIAERTSQINSFKPENYFVINAMFSEVHARAVAHNFNSNEKQDSYTARLKQIFGMRPGWDRKKLFEKLLEGIDISTLAGEPISEEEYGSNTSQNTTEKNFSLGLKPESGLNSKIFSETPPTSSPRISDNKNLGRAGLGHPPQNENDGQPSDENSDRSKSGLKLKSEQSAVKVLADLENSDSLIIDLKGALKNIPPPELFDLTELQREANRRYSFTAEKTLKIAQSLYERHKVLSYPRTDSRHLTPDVAQDFVFLAKTFVESLQIKRGSSAPNSIDSSHLKEAVGLKFEFKMPSKRYVDASKVSDHHALIPIAMSSNLNADEKKIYDLVWKRSLMIFLGSKQTQETMLITCAVSFSRIYVFESKANLILDKGWSILDGAVNLEKIVSDPKTIENCDIENLDHTDDNGFSSPPIRRPKLNPASLLSNKKVVRRSEKTSENPHLEMSVLPLWVKQGVAVIGQYSTDQKTTTPPKAFTDASLLSAMEYCSKKIGDSSLRQAIKENGLGTPATRAQTIELLFQRKYAFRQGKYIFSTPLGEELLSIVHPSLKSVELTASWEKGLEMVRLGKISPDEFDQKIEDFVKKLLSQPIPAQITAAQTTAAQTTAAQTTEYDFLRTAVQSIGQRQTVVSASNFQVASDRSHGPLSHGAGSTEDHRSRVGRGSSDNYAFDKLSQNAHAVSDSRIDSPTDHTANDFNVRQGSHGDKILVDSFEVNGALVSPLGQDLLNQSKLSFPLRHGEESFLETTEALVYKKGSSAQGSERTKLEFGHESPEDLGRINANQKKLEKSGDQHNAFVTEKIEKSKTESVVFSHMANTNQANPQGMDAGLVLRQIFKLTGFREGQKEIIESVIQGRDAMVLMPTGGGKSLCFQIPGIIRAGLTVVISPLLALIDDQVNRLAEKGIPASGLHSGMSQEEQRSVWRRINAGELKFLFLSPEKMSGSQFRERIIRLPLALLVVDEAHCVSQWGHDFRPDYREIGQWISQVRPAPIMALTASATEQVSKDIQTVLKLYDPYVHIGGFFRSNLSIFVRHVLKVDRIQVVSHWLSEAGRLPAIVYSGSRKDTEIYAAFLERKFRTKPFHAGMSANQRAEIQKQFLDGDLDVIVATVAFGMGVDKSNIRSVVHASMPGSIEAYYQEIGRAGRDGRPSDCLLLRSHEDKELLQWFLGENYPDIEKLKKVLTDLKKSKAVPPSKAGLIDKLIVHGAVLKDERGSYVVKAGTGWQSSYLGQLKFREEQLQAMLRLAESSQACRMVSLVSYFGQNDQAPCGICDVCLGEAGSLTFPSSAINRQSFQRSLKEKPYKKTTSKISKSQGTKSKQSAGSPDSGISSQLVSSQQVSSQLIPSQVVIDILGSEGEMTVGKLRGEISKSCGIGSREVEDLLANLQDQKLLIIDEKSFYKEGKKILYRSVRLAKSKHLSSDREHGSQSLNYTFDSAIKPRKSLSRHRRDSAKSLLVSRVISRTRKKSTKRK